MSQQRSSSNRSQEGGVLAPAYASLVFSGDEDRRELARAHDRGQLVRLAPGIYTPDTSRTPEQVVHDRLWPIVAHEIPGAVIVDRSVRDGGTGRNGALYVVGTRSRPLKLPGVVVYPRAGAGPLPSDMSLPDGLYMSSEARGLLDNLAPTRVTATGASRTLTRAEVEEWLDSLCAARGEPALNRLRDQARELAPVLGREKELAILEALISAALNTRDGVSLVSPAMKARAAGRPVDQQRLDAFARLANSLADLAPDVVPALPQDEERRQLLPFYEAYFSNYIEGTEFTLDEAAAIVFDNAVPEQRPEDAHDVLGTYQITSSHEEMRRTPESADELVDILKYRHAILLGARTEKSPGQFKTRANRAGSTEFVAPELVEGTLHSGFDEGKALVSPFARAVFMMFLVSEVHPFVDGNGRVARLMMNSELARAGEVRIVIPTVYRLNYLAGLKAVTHTANDSALVAILSFARRWTARINFSNRATAEADLERTNALRDAREAEDAGIRLTMP